MFAAQLYNPQERGLKNAKAVVGLQWILESLRSTAFKFLLYLVGFPLFFIFGFWLKMRRKKFQKNMKKNAPIFDTHQDYVKFKTELATFEVLLPALNVIADIDLKKTPLTVIFTMGQMKKMASTLITYTNWLQTRLAPVNKEQFTATSKTFRLVSEKELWKNRNPSYQYWM